MPHSVESRLEDNHLEEDDWEELGMLALDVSEFPKDCVADETEIFASGTFDEVVRVVATLLKDEIGGKDEVDEDVEFDA